MRKSNLVSNRTEKENAPIATRFRLNENNFFTVLVRYYDHIYKDSDMPQRQLIGSSPPPSHLKTACTKYLFSVKQ